MEPNWLKLELEVFVLFVGILLLLLRLGLALLALLLGDELADVLGLARLFLGLVRVKLKVAESESRRIESNRIAKLNHWCAGAGPMGPSTPDITRGSPSDSALPRSACAGVLHRRCAVPLERNAIQCDCDADRAGPTN